MDARTLTIFESSLGRCSANPEFFERFYRIFLATSPRIAEKFAKTDFVHQKRALKASLHIMLLAVSDGANGPGRYLRELADRHSSRDLNIGSEFYDYWLDSLLEAVRETDPDYTDGIRDAWEKVMMIGITYMLSRF